MDNLLEFNTFINTELDENFIEINDNYSSEFFNYDEYLAEKYIYDETILEELKRIKPHLREGKQWKNVTRRYFELETEYVKNLLNKDKKYVNERVLYIVEQLQLLNEESDDYNLNEKRKNKITILESYKRSQIRKINKEIKLMVEFYQSNPKILVT
jgi:flagellar biosynthesis regulator FlbT